jgi:hypothetical protein
MHGKIYYAGEINEDTSLYRYMSLSQFISFVELGNIYLKNVTKSLYVTLYFYLNLNNL